MKIAKLREAATRHKNEPVAVALSYDSAMFAPSVAATGRQKLAQTIARAARRYGIPVVYDNKLASKLSSTQLDHFIPEDLYQEVAQLFLELD